METCLTNLIWQMDTIKFGVKQEFKDTSAIAFLYYKKREY